MKIPTHNQFPEFNLPHLFNELFVGYNDRFLKMHQMHNLYTKSLNNYPPVNIKRQGDDPAKYIIEVAVAGFKRAELDVSITWELDSQLLTIKGQAGEKPDRFMFKGIGSRNFTRKFVLGEHLEFIDCFLKDGILEVHFLEPSPEVKKQPSPIKIGDGPKVESVLK